MLAVLVFSPPIGRKLSFQLTVVSGLQRSYQGAFLKAINDGDSSAI